MPTSSASCWLVARPSFWRLGENPRVLVLDQEGASNSVELYHYEHRQFAKFYRDLPDQLNE